MSWPYNWPGTSAPKHVPASGGYAPAWSTPVALPPVKCPDCGVWWRTMTHKCKVAAPSPSEESGE